MKLKRILSDLPSFKSITFKDGLNILLAEKSPESSERETRNRAGKTSFVELIHFLFGDKAGPDSLFRVPQLNDYSFGVEVEIQNEVCRLSRSGTKPSRIIVETGNTSRWPIQPSNDRKTGERVISNSNWKASLGSLLFNLPTFDDEDSALASAPSFRSIFPYFVRRQNGGGFLEPFRHTEEQQVGDMQVALSFLMGLDWTLPSEWQVVREKERTLRELKKASGAGALGPIIGSVASLRTRLALAEDNFKSLSVAVDTFKVLPEYHKFEEEASQITRTLSDLANEDFMDRHLINELKKSFNEEKVPESIDLDRVYKEAGTVFTETTLRRFEDVKKFHESVIGNRRAYLNEELLQTERRIQERASAMAKLDLRRSDIMVMLKSHGALDHYSKLQQELTKVKTDVENLRKQYEIAETLESSKSEMNVERGRLLKQLQHDYQENKKTLDHIILTFEKISAQLYENAGSLIISESPNGPVFDIEIQGSRSKGISNMQIFCFDLMTTQLCQERGIGPGFLIHDSHLFDGVDSRQIAKAVVAGKQFAEKHGIQYVITLNSDILNSVKSDTGLDLSKDVLTPVLTDKSESGGLFGFRF